MSRINFAPIRETHPELGHAWRSLEGWVQSHPDVRFLETRRLARELYPVVGALELTKALQELEKSGQVTMTFRVVDPSGSILDEDFTNLDEIPPAMRDRMSDHWFDVESRNILPVFWIQG